MMDTKPVIVEFAGGSCVGKSYVKDNVLKHLSYSHKCFDISDVKLTLLDCISFFVSFPFNWTMSSVFIVCSIPMNYFLLFKLLKKWFTVQIKMKKASRMNYDFVLFDEGFFKWLANIRSNSIRKPIFEKVPLFIKKRWFYPDIVIFVAAEFDFVQKNRMYRGRKPLKNKARFTKYQSARYKDVSYAEEKGFIKVIKYNNREDIFETSVIEHIMDIYEKKTCNN